MQIKKAAVLEALSKISAPGEGVNLVESGAVTNVQIFGDEVTVDISIANPSLQARKKTEVEVLKIIHSEVYEKAKITVNVKVVTPPKTWTLVTEPLSTRLTPSPGADILDNASNTAAFFICILRLLVT